MSRIWVRCRPEVRQWLEHHPKVDLSDEISSHPLEFEQNGKIRVVEMGQREGLRGLVELIDNNPLVCTDQFSVPDVGGTLALVALGPLLRAGLVVEPPGILASFALDEEGVKDAMGTEGWTQGFTAHCEDRPLSSVVALNAMALVQTTGDVDELDSIFDEVYGRSFLVRRVEEGDWDVDLVAGKPWAAYRLRVTPSEDHALLTIQTMSDLNGKVGGAQLVHAMNVMAGFEENLGLL